jgi:hypothetical protein
LNNHRISGDCGTIFGWRCLPTDFLPSSTRKRKEGDTDEEAKVEVEDGVDGIVDDGNDVVAAATPVKRAPDRRKWCFRCKYWKRVPNNETNRVWTLSSMEGAKPKKTTCFCMRCQIALCQDCFKPWHEKEGLLPTPTEPEGTEPATDV